MQKAADQNLSEENTSEFVLNMMLAPDGPVMEMLRPFVSEQLGVEAVIVLLALVVVLAPVVVVLVVHSSTGCL